MGDGTSRRKFLKKTGLALGALALTGIVCANTGKAALDDPAAKVTINYLRGKKPMGKVLVAYASKCGSTGEIAAAVGEEINKAGFDVDVMPVERIKSVEMYEKIILGTALRFEKPLPAMMDFIGAHEKILSHKQIAYFSAGVYMREPTEENREKTRKMLEPMASKLPDPVDIAMFGGMVDYTTIAPFWRVLISMDSSGLMREGDGRDWKAIRAWAEKLGGKFLA